MRSFAALVVLLALVCTSQAASPISINLGSDCGVGGAACNFLAAITSKILGNNDVVFVNAADLTQSYNLAIDDFSAFSFGSTTTIVINTSATVTLQSTGSGIKKFTSELITAANSTVNFAGNLAFSQAAYIQGAAVVAGNAAFQQGVSVAASASITVQASASVTVSGAMNLTGQVITYGNATFQATSATVYAKEQSIKNATITVASNTAIYARDSAVSIRNYVVTGINNTITAATITVQKINSTAFSTARFAGNVVQSTFDATYDTVSSVNGNVTFGGSSSTGSGSTSSSATFSGTFNVGPAGSIYVNTGSSVSFNYGAFINGTVTLADNTYVTARNSADNAVSYLGNILVQGVNTTVNTANAVAAQLKTTASSTVTFVGNVTFTTASQVQGAVIVAGNAAFQTAISTSASASITVQASASVAVSGAVSFAGQIVTYGNATVQATSATIYAKQQAIQNATITLAANTILYAQDAAIVARGIVIQGANNTVTAATITVQKINSTSNSIVFFVGNVVQSTLDSTYDAISSVNGNATFTGSSSTGSGSSSSSASFSSNVNVGPAGSIYVDVGTSIFFNYGAVISGTVTLADNAYVATTSTANGVVNTLGNIIARGVNTTVRVASATIISARATSGAAVTFIGNFVAQSTITVQGSLTIGSSSDSSSGSSSSSFQASGDVAVSVGGNLTIYANTFIGGVFSIAQSSYVQIVQGVTNTTAAIASYGQTTIRSTLIAAAYTQRAAYLFIQRGILTASSVTIGAQGDASSSSAIAGGDGTIQGSLTVNTAIYLNSTLGSQTVTGNVNIASGANFIVDYRGSSSSNAKLSASGNVAYNGVLIVYASTVPSTYTFASFSGSSSGSFSSINANVQGTVQYNAKDTTFVATAATGTINGGSTTTTTNGGGATAGTGTTTRNFATSLTSNVFAVFACLILVLSL